MLTQFKQTTARVSSHMAINAAIGACSGALGYAHTHQQYGVAGFNDSQFIQAMALGQATLSLATYSIVNSRLTYFNQFENPQLAKLLFSGGPLSYLTGNVVSKIMSLENNDVQAEFVCFAATVGAVRTTMALTAVFLFCYHIIADFPGFMSVAAGPIPLVERERFTMDK